LPIAFEYADLRIAVYAALSLTVIRMVPVFLSLWGSGLDRPTTTFLAWFGPRGLASIVFSLLALEELGLGEETKTAVGAVALTVALSVLLHGVTAGPGGRAYVRRESAEQGASPRARPSAFAPASGPRTRSSQRSGLTGPQPARFLARWPDRFRHERITDVYPG
jgi:NhaP-type Na+/H+ or K+/H+ antiporter